MHLGRQVSATELGPRYQADRRHAPYKESRICFSCSIPVRNRAAMRSSPPAPEQSPVTHAARLPRITRLLALAVHSKACCRKARCGTTRIWRAWAGFRERGSRSEEHTSELQSLRHLVCRLLLEKK